jgi:ribosomal protein L12E/L44/L45/RPP1/RPP2
VNQVDGTPIVNFLILQGHIRQNRILHLRQSLEQICGSAGWTVSHYWMTALEEAVHGEDFKDLLCAEVKHQNTLHRGAITKAFEAALRGKARWISSETDGSIVIADPDAAIKWFLSSSRRRDLIPKELADMVVPPTVAAPVPAPLSTTSDEAAATEQAAEIETPERSKGGRPEATDWGAIEIMFNEKLAEEGGAPDNTGGKGWRKQADAEDWVADLIEDQGDEASPSTVRTHVRQMLKRYREKRAET